MLALRTVTYCTENEETPLSSAAMAFQIAPMGSAFESKLTNETEDSLADAVHLLGHRATRPNDPLRGQNYRSMLPTLNDRCPRKPPLGPPSRTTQISLKLSAFLPRRQSTPNPNCKTVCSL